MILDQLNLCTFKHYALHYTTLYLFLEGLYCIVGNLREKTHEYIGRLGAFCGENFSTMLISAIIMWVCLFSARTCATHLHVYMSNGYKISLEKLLWMTQKQRKMRKFSPLKVSHHTVVDW